MTSTTDGDTLFDVYQALDMDLAMAMEQRFTDDELGLVAQSPDRPDYPTLS